MKVECKFLVSATNPSQIPAPDVPEIAFLGRSNVGKSSLLNSLVGSKMAHVSSTPGRTRAINFFDIFLRNKSAAPDLRFVDLPGYGYARVSKSITAEWPKFINPYLQRRENLLACIVLVDCNVPPRPSDQQLIEFLRVARRSFVMVATKTDRLSGNTLRNSLNNLRREFEVAEIVPYSSKTASGRDELWKAIKKLMVECRIVHQKP